MAVKDKEGWLTLVFGIDGRVVHETDRWGKHRGTIWRIWMEMRIQGYYLPDWIWKTMYPCPYRVYGEQNLKYPEGNIDSHTMFCQVAVCHDAFTRVLLSLCHPQLVHPRSTQSQDIHLDLCMPQSWVNTKYSIPQLLHLPSSTEFPKYCITQRLTVFCTQPVSVLWAELIVLNSLHSHKDKLTNT